MNYYSDKEINLLKEIHKEKIFTNAEMKSLLSKNEIKRLKAHKLFNMSSINGATVYSLNKKSSMIINVPYENTGVLEENTPSYIPNINDERLLKTIAFCGHIREDHISMFFPKANVKSCLLDGYLLRYSINGQAVIKIDLNGKKYLKKINCNYIRKHSSLNFANYLLQNYLLLPRKSKKSYFLRKPSTVEIGENIDFFRNGSYIILDIESVCYGNRSNNKIIEIGAIKVSNGHIVEKFQRFINSEDNSIPKNISDLTGITPSMLQTGISLESATNEFLEFMGDLPVLAHGIENDWHEYMLSTFYRFNMNIPVNIIIDTYSIINSLYPDCKNGLDALVNRYEIDTVKTPRHRALNDCILTHEILLNVFEKKKETA